METLFHVECQFISAGYNLKQWDLVKNSNLLNSNQEHEVMKSPGTEFLSPTHPSGRQPFSSLVLDSSAKSIAALIICNQELYISTLIEGMGFKKMLLNSPQCLVFIGMNDNFIAVGCNKGVFIVDTNIPKVIEFIRLPILDHKTDTVLCIDSSHDPLNPNLIAFATDLGLLYYFNCFHERGNPEQIGTKDSNSKILNVKFCPHLFSYLITAHSSGTVIIWDLTSNSCIHSLSFNSNTSSASLDFSHIRNDYLLCIGWNDGIIAIFDFKLMKKITQFNIPDSTITGLLFLQNGVNLIVGDSLGQIHIYNSNTQKVSRAYRLHSSTLKGLALKNSKHLCPGKHSSNGAQLQSLGAPQSFEDKDIVLQQSNEHKYLANFHNSLNPITARFSSIKSNTRPINAESAKSPIIISPLRVDINCSQQFPNALNLTSIYSRPIEETHDHYPEYTQISNPVQTFIDNRKLSKREITQKSSLVPYVCSRASPLISTMHEDRVSEYVEDSLKIVPDDSGSFLQESPHLKRTSRNSLCEENDSPKINESGRYLEEDIPVKNTHKSNKTSISQNHNIVDVNYIQSIIEHHSSDIKDFFGEQIINLLGEITRNVTNQQLQITSLHNKLDILISSMEKINRTMSQNPHLL